MFEGWWISLAIIPTFSNECRRFVLALKSFPIGFLNFEDGQNKFQQLLLETFHLLYAIDEQNLVWLVWKNEKISQKDKQNLRLTYFRSGSFSKILLTIALAILMRWASSRLWLVWKKAWGLENQSIPTLEDPGKMLKFWFQRNYENLPFWIWKHPFS